MERIIRHESFARRIDFRFLQVVQLHPCCGVNTDPLEIRYSILLSRDIYEEIIDQPNRAHFSIHEFPSTKKSIQFSLEEVDY